MHWMSLTLGQESFKKMHRSFGGKIAATVLLYLALIKHIIQLNFFLEMVEIK